MTEDVAARPRRSQRPIAVDLFAGAGGLSLGFEQAGFDIVAGVDYDPVHGMVHRYNFPDCEMVCRDIHKLNGPDVLDAARRGMSRLPRGDNWDGVIDAVIGGPSCQGFSTGGLRDDDDERNELLNQFVRLVCDLKPRVFCLENVRGLLEPRFEAFRRTALKQLRDAGYALSGADQWYDAADFGVPQSRKRVIILGVLDGPAAELEPSSLLSPVTVAEALDGLPRIENYARLMTSSEARLSGGDQRRRAATKSDYARALAGLGDGFERSRPRVWDGSLLTCSKRTVHQPETIKRFEATMPGEVEPKSRLFRLANEGVSRTLRAGTGRERGAHTSPRPIHPIEPRVITVREAARLHGYPDWFRFSETSWHGHRQIGNSVPPPLARAAGMALVHRLGSKPRRPSKVASLGEAAWCAVTPSEASKLLHALPAELPPQRARPQQAADG